MGNSHHVLWDTNLPSLPVWGQAWDPGWARVYFWVFVGFMRSVLTQVHQNMYRWMISTECIFQTEEKKKKKGWMVKGYVFLKKSFRTCLFLWDFWILFYSRRMHIEWGFFFSLQINIFEDAEQTTASSNNRFILSLGDIQKYMNALYTSLVGVDNRVVTEPHPCLHGTHS